MILEKLDQSSKLIDEQVKQIDLFVEENLVHQLELQIIGSRTTRMKYQHYFDLVLSECSRKLVIRNSADFKLIEPNFQNLTLAIDAPETDEKRMTFWKELSTELARLDTVHVLKINLNKAEVRDDELTLIADKIIAPRKDQLLKLCLKLDNGECSIESTQKMLKIVADIKDLTVFGISLNKASSAKEILASIKDAVKPHSFLRQLTVRSMESKISEEDLLEFSRDLDNVEICDVH